MKRILEWRLFNESNGEDPYKEMWEIFDDIKSIEYIVEEGGYNIHYDFMFKEKARPGHRARISNFRESTVSAFIRNNLIKKYGDFVGFRIEISYPRDLVVVNAGGQIKLTKEQITELSYYTERYSNLLRLHLEDYVDNSNSKFIKHLTGATGKNILIVEL